MNDAKPIGIPSLISLAEQMDKDNPLLKEMKTCIERGEVMPNIPEMGRFWTAVGSALQLATNGRPLPRPLFKKPQRICANIDLREDCERIALYPSFFSQPMKAIVYDAPRQFKYKEVPEPKIESDDVLVRIDACGLCGTDLHIHEGEFAPSFPLIPGHEFTGEIVALGSAVKDLKERQRVVGNSNESCGKCFYCMRGDFLLCLNLRAYGVTQDGGFAQYLRIKADRIFPIGNLSPREAVMVEPSACAVHGMEVLAMKPGSDVLLFGAGSDRSGPGAIAETERSRTTGGRCAARSETGTGRPSGRR